jgi:hypothetical protein
MIVASLRCFLFSGGTRALNQIVARRKQQTVEGQSKKQKFHPTRFSEIGAETEFSRQWLS